MSRRALHAQVQDELHALYTQGILDRGQMRALLERYPTSGWRLTSLPRWFTVLGAVAMTAGLVLLAQRWVGLEAFAEATLGLATLAGIVGGRWLRTARGLLRTGRALELVGGFALEGLSFVVASYHSAGSHQWPALVGANACGLVVLAYALKNPLVLVDACANLFVFFGGETGYAAGVYWLGMTYPVRFFAAGAVSAFLGWAHARLDTPWRPFAAVWAHVGLLVANCSLWFLALFGYFTEQITWENNTCERLAFTALWALVSAGLLWVGMLRRVRILRGYGLTFLGINAFTVYAQFIAANSGGLWFAHLLVLGGALVGLGVWAERRRSAQRLTRNTWQA